MQLSLSKLLATGILGAACTVSFAAPVQQNSQQSQSGNGSSANNNSQLNSSEQKNNAPHCQGGTESNCHPTAIWCFR